MTNFFIIHGSYGHPNENWFPWLKDKLKKESYNVFVPKFPTPQNQNLSNWLKTFDKYKRYLDEETVLIGHSIGCAFILNLLERIDTKIKACFLVAGFLKKLNKPEFIELNRTFVDKAFDLKKIVSNCDKFYVFNSDNDPNVPLEKGYELAEKLGVDLILVKNAGHFNEKAGYTKFEFLFEKIKEAI